MHDSVPNIVSPCPWYNLSHTSLPTTVRHCMRQIRLYERDNSLQETLPVLPASPNPSESNERST
ncbi:hypothetical protein BJX99DRAFT_223337 [Aspergillus californicus]